MRRGPSEEPTEAVTGQADPRRLTGQRVRTIEAAAIAGVLYAALTLGTRFLIDRVPDLDDPELVQWYTDTANQDRLITALTLTSIATVTFLWFIAVIRRRIGDREDQFFSTVFIGSGIVLIVARLLAAAATVFPAVSARLLDADIINETMIASAEGLGGAVTLVIAPRMQAVFVVTTSTIIFRSRALPSWLALVGYAIGVVLFIVPFVIEPMDLVFPLWVLLVSVVLLVTGTHDLDLVARDETPTGH